MRMSAVGYDLISDIKYSEDDANINTLSPLYEQNYLTDKFLNYSICRLY